MWKGANIFRNILHVHRWFKLLKNPSLHGYLRIKDVLRTQSDNPAYILTTEQVNDIFSIIPDSKRKRQFQEWFHKLNTGIIKIILCKKQKLNFKDCNKLYFQTSDSHQAFTLQHLTQLYMQSKSENIISSTDDSRPLNLQVCSVKPPLQDSCSLDLQVINRCSVEPQEHLMDLKVINRCSVEPQEHLMDLKVINRCSVEPQDSPLDLRVVKFSTISHENKNEQCVNTDNVTLLTEDCSKSYQINEDGDIVKYTAYDITQSIPSGLHQPYTEWDEDFKLYLYMPCVQSMPVKYTQNFDNNDYTDMILNIFENSKL